MDDAETAATLARARELEVRVQGLADGMLLCESNTLCDKKAKFMDDDPKRSVYCEDCWPEWKGYVDPEPIA